MQKLSEVITDGTEARFYLGLPDPDVVGRRETGGDEARTQTPSSPGSVLGPGGHVGVGVAVFAAVYAHECPQAFTPPARGLAR